MTFETSGSAGLLQRLQRQHRCLSQGGGQPSECRTPGAKAYLGSRSSSVQQHASKPKVATVGQTGVGYLPSEEKQLRSSALPRSHATTAQRLFDSASSCRPEAMQPKRG